LTLWRCSTVLLAREFELYESILCGCSIRLLSGVVISVPALRVLIRQRLDDEHDH
jgi:hypothetical protein